MPGLRFLNIPRTHHSGSTVGPLTTCFRDIYSDDPRYTLPPASYSSRACRACLALGSLRVYFPEAANRARREDEKEFLQMQLEHHTTFLMQPVSFFRITLTHRHCAGKALSPPTPESPPVCRVLQPYYAVGIYSAF